MLLVSAADVHSPGNVWCDNNSYTDRRNFLGVTQQYLTVCCLGEMGPGGTMKFS